MSIRVVPITDACMEIVSIVLSHPGKLLNRATAKTAYSALRCPEIMRATGPVRDIEITIVVAAILCAVAFFAT